LFLTLVSISLTIRKSVDFFKLLFVWGFRLYLKLSLTAALSSVPSSHLLHTATHVRCLPTHLQMAHPSTSSDDASPLSTEYRSGVGRGDDDDDDDDGRSFSTCASVLDEVAVTGQWLTLSRTNGMCMCKYYAAGSSSVLRVCGGPLLCTRVYPSLHKDAVCDPTTHAENGNYLELAPTRKDSPYRDGLFSSRQSSAERQAGVKLTSAMHLETAHALGHTSPGTSRSFRDEEAVTGKTPLPGNLSHSMAFAYEFVTKDVSAGKKDELLGYMMKTERALHTLARSSNDDVEEGNGGVSARLAETLSHALNVHQGGQGIMGNVRQKDTHWYESGPGMCGRFGRSSVGIFESMGTRGAGTRRHDLYSGRSGTASVRHQAVSSNHVSR
jgi:hypothetical protein